GVSPRDSMKSNHALLRPTGVVERMVSAAWFSTASYLCSPLASSRSSPDATSAPAASPRPASTRVARPTSPARTISTRTSPLALLPEPRPTRGGQIPLSGEDVQLETLPLLRRVVEQSDPRVVPGTLVVVDVESVEDPDSSALEEPPPPRGVLEQFEQFSGIAS